MKFEKEPGAQVHRHQRVESSILEELRSILRDDIENPVLEGVVLTAIVLAPDSKIARVHFAVPRGRPRKDVEEAFARATGFMRARLADGVELKRNPDLRFIFEAEIDSGQSE